MERNAEVVHNYAQAFLNAARKESTPLPEVLEETRSLRELMNTQRRLKVFLDVPKFRQEAKATLLQKAFEGRISQLHYRFMHLLLRRGRIDYLSEILEKLEMLIEKAMGLTPGVVLTAVPPTDEEKARFQERLDAYCDRKFDLKFKVDPNLIGGVRIVFEDQLIDTTIAARLEELRRRMWLTRLTF